MADDFYGDSEMSDSAPKDIEASESQTEVLPKSFCPGMEPGDIIKCRVEKVTETQYVISYVDDESEDEEVEENEAEEEMSPMDDMMA